MNNYAVQDLVQTQVTFTAIQTGLSVDPTIVQVTITYPDDTSQTFDLTSGVIRTGVGLYYYQFVVEQFGIHIYRWQGEGAVIASSGNGFLRGI